MSLIGGVAALLLGVSGAAMVVAGPIMAAQGRRGRTDISAELAKQAISFPKSGLPDELAAHAGQEVRTGPQARAYAAVIGNNVRLATGGRSYAEVSAELAAAGGDDEKLAGLRQMAFMGEMLRASLLNAYQAWQLTTLVIGLGALLVATGVALLAAAVTFASNL